MNDLLRDAYAAELVAADIAMGGGSSELAFYHLERAHILGQRYTTKHVYVHWLMLRLAASSGAWRELLGQLPRIIAAGMFSKIWIPIGNTGRANVSAMKPMPIPGDLRALLENDGP